MDECHRNLLDRNIRGIHRAALRISLRSPSLAVFLARTALRERRAARRRQELEAAGTHVPPFLIASITRACNLHCAGCYAQAKRREDDLSLMRWGEIMDEAESLGVSFVLLAGGEPLTRPGILDVTRAHPHMVFPLFTNGTLLDDGILDTLSTQRNVIPVVSLEGGEQQTDERRGGGVYHRVRSALREMGRRRMFFGASLTVTADNYPTVTNPDFVQGLRFLGCRIFFFVEYTAVAPGTEHLVPTPLQRREILQRTSDLQERFRALFISFPGDEQMYGGCLAAGRGFVHISSDGGLEPCPLAPYSDTSLRDRSLADALQSGFLAAIRSSDEHLTEDEGGCALWNKREWVQSLLRDGAGHTA